MREERDGASTPLEELALPTRMQSYARREGLETLGELAHIAPKLLLRERNIGRKSIAQTRAVLEEHLGASWEDLARAARPAALDTPLPATRWEELRTRIPPPFGATPLAELRLSARVCAYADREGIRTVGEMAARPSAQLLAARNFGRASIARLFAAVREHMARAAGREEVAGRGLLDAWKTLLLDLSEDLRAVVIALAGLDGQVKAPSEIMARLGIRHATNVVRVEHRALAELRRERVCLGAIRRRIHASLPGGAAPLSALAVDPWWSTIVAVPHALDYFGRRLLGGAIRVVKVDEEPYCAGCKQVTLDDAWRALRAGAARVAKPATPAAYRALLAPWEPRIGAVLVEALVERLLRERARASAGGGA